MHSSRMRTANVLTVFPGSLSPGGGGGYFPLDEDPRCRSPSEGKPRSDKDIPPEGRPHPDADPTQKIDPQMQTPQIPTPRWQTPRFRPPDADPPQRADPPRCRPPQKTEPP